MSEVIQTIPARVKNMAIGGHVAGTDDIIDDALGKTQKEINTETSEKIEEIKEELLELHRTLLSR